MKLLLIFCFSLFSLVEADYVPQEKKDSIVMVVRPEAKSVFAALIDGKPYLVEAQIFSYWKRSWQVWLSVERIRMNIRK